MTADAQPAHRKKRLDWQAKVAILLVLTFLIGTIWVMVEPISDIATWNGGISLRRTGGGSLTVRYISRNLQGTAWLPELREGWLSLGPRNGPAIEVSWSSQR